MTLIDDDYKDIYTSQLTNSAKNYYQVIIYELENQLSLKQSLIEQHVVAIKTKEAQLNKLIEELNSTSNQESKKLESLVDELRNSLNEKDILYKNTLEEHFELIKQKDSLILNLRTSSSHLLAQLDQSNELIHSQKNQIVTLQNDINYLRDSNKDLEHIVHTEYQNYQLIIFSRILQIALKLK